MGGCLKFTCFIFAGFLGLYLLFTDQKSLFWIVISGLIGYYVGSKQQKSRDMLKDKASTDQVDTDEAIVNKAIADKAEADKAEADKVQIEIVRQGLIKKALQREDLFVYEPSKSVHNIRSTQNIFEVPEKWAKSIENRYNEAQEHLKDVKIVVANDIDDLYQYRNNLKSKFIPKYEAAINPFLDELILIDSEIPTPRPLEVAIEFTFPSDLQPTAIQKSLQLQFDGCRRSLNNFMAGKDITKFKKDEYILVILIFAFHYITFLINASKQRKELEKIQAEVDAICAEISGAISTYGISSEEIKHAKIVHEVAVSFVTPHLDLVAQITSQGKSISELTEKEKKAVETCYRGGQSLKLIMQKEIVQPINRNN